MIDDVLYYIEMDMSRKKIYKMLKKCDFDIDATVDKILQFEEQKQHKKDMKIAIKVSLTELAPPPPEGKIQWPTTESPSKKKQKDSKKSYSGMKKRRDSVNIEVARKTSKRLLSNFKCENTSKSFWNQQYPIIEYPL